MLSLEGCSLAEVRLVNPVWEVPTMKVKTVAGIALGLEFVHAFGIIHDSLQAHMILFGESHRTQITGFGLIELEMQQRELRWN
jgi:hypothetical protein